MRATIVLLTLLAGPALIASADPLSKSEYVLWTNCTITLYDHADPAILDAAFARLHELDSRLSVNQAGSELDAVSDAAGKKPVAVDGDVLFVIDKALELAGLSGGLFDPTVGPLMRAWKMNTENGAIPAPDVLQKARGLVNWRDVVLDRTAQTIYLRRAGMRLDAGALLKGYAADETQKILRDRGVSSAIIDLGGDIYALGSRTDGTPWRIGIQNPDATRGQSLGVARVVSKSVVSSGSYEHYFVQNGKRYHHIMDTRTGFPVDNGLDQVTVISDASIDADGLGLTLFTMGPQDGMDFARAHGIDAILVTEDRRVYATDGARRMFTLTDAEFHFAE